MKPSDQLIKDPVTRIENQWYLYRCGVNHAWEWASGKGVVIADIDWGFRTTHQELRNRIELTFNSIDGSSDVSQGTDLSHGTAVLGLTAAARNEFGMQGFAFGASLWAIQAADGAYCDVQKSLTNAIDFVRRTDSRGRRKVVMLEVQTDTRGNYEMMGVVNQAIVQAIRRDIVVCVAAGNGDRDAGLDDLGKPIPCTGSILVGATNFHPTENRRADSSNWGPRIVVSAPGDESHDMTCSSHADFGYRNGFGGTSGATAKVAGTIALMLEVNPKLSHHEVREILSDTGTPITTSASKPIGTFLNARDAVREAKRRAEF